MNRIMKKPRLLMILVLGVAAILPPLLYHTAVSGAMTIEPAAVIRTLTFNDDRVVVVDVRHEGEFTAASIHGAVNWPWHSIRELAHADEVPGEYRNKKLYLVCNSGVLSARAAKKLTAFGLDASSVRGGLEKFPQSAPHSSQSMGPVMEWLAAVTAFFIKPLYMVLSLLLAWFLRRRREADLSALKWAMIFFFAGEFFCAVNYLFFNEGSYLAEHLHMFGMALAFGFTILAAAEFMDRRIIHFSAEARNCSLLAACGKCYKDAPVACSLRIVFIIVLPCLALLCAMPPLVRVSFATQGTVILGTPYTYAHPVLYQLFETRYSPLLAALFFTTALLAFLLRRERAWSTAKLFFACGAGFLSFAFFRLVLFSLFRERLYWFVIWEEWTEMMFIAALWLFILLFRKKPLLNAAQP